MVDFFVALHELSHVMTVSVGHTQEFWENFKFLLKEAVDTYSGSKKEKYLVLNNRPLLNWAKVISWKELKIRLDKIYYKKN